MGVFIHNVSLEENNFLEGEIFFSPFPISIFQINGKILNRGSFDAVRQLNSTGSTVDSMPLCPVLSRRVKRSDRLHPLRSPSPGKIQPLPADRKTPP
jgi:hypothetical protein